MVDTLRRQYDRIPQNRRGLALIGAIVVIYVLGLVLPGTGPFLRDKMPHEVVVIGLITGTVTSLLAMGLILLYRSNRFINFAYGAMGSMVGVLAIALYKEHG